MKNIKQTRREAKRLFSMCLVNGLLDEDRTHQVVHRIIAAKRRGGLALLSRFLYLVKLDCARHRAEVVSAAPLPSDLQTTIQADLVRVYGPGVVASFTQNPALIGGMRIKVGSDVYDGSIRARLAGLERSF
jgi:F-type H+-transporting ATPase subunit delta